MDAVNLKSKDNMPCATKYPILLVHGIFAEDTQRHAYWGDIPTTLIKNGAVIFYGRQPFALSVKHNAEILAENIKSIITTTKCGKLNVIAHSKGGLEMRYAISHLNISQYIASLTTISTPHRGCGYIDYLIKRIPSFVYKPVFSVIDAVSNIKGKKSEALQAILDLCESNCTIFNRNTPDCKEVYYQSVAPYITTSKHCSIPLKLSYKLMQNSNDTKHSCSVRGDGVVTMRSAKWGSICMTITNNDGYGVTHENIVGRHLSNKMPDIPKFYVRLVQKLQQMGL